MDGWVGYTRAEDDLVRNRLEYRQTHIRDRLVQGLAEDNPNRVCLERAVSVFMYDSVESHHHLHSVADVDAMFKTCSAGCSEVPHWGLLQRLLERRHNPCPSLIMSNERPLKTRFISIERGRVSVAHTRGDSSTAAQRSLLLCCFVLLNHLLFKSGDMLLSYLHRNKKYSKVIFLTDRAVVCALSWTLTLLYKQG